MVKSGGQRSSPLMFSLHTTPVCGQPRAICQYTGCAALRVNHRLPCQPIHSLAYRSILPHPRVPLSAQLARVVVRDDEGEAASFFSGQVLYELSDCPVRSRRLGSRG